MERLVVRDDDMGRDRRARLPDMTKTPATHEGVTGVRVLLVSAVSDVDL